LLLHSGEGSVGRRRLLPVLVQLLCQFVHVQGKCGVFISVCCVALVELLHGGLGCGECALQGGHFLVPFEVGGMCCLLKGLGLVVHGGGDAGELGGEGSEEMGGDGEGGGGRGWLGQGRGVFVGEFG
jgi:hypothetical protein